MQEGTPTLLRSMSIASWRGENHGCPDHGRGTREVISLEETRAKGGEEVGLPSSCKSPEEVVHVMDFSLLRFLQELHEGNL